MKMITGLYAAETAFLGLFCLVFSIGKPLVAGASLHNLSEWWIHIHLTNGTTQLNVIKFSTNAVFWVFSVISVTLMVPSLATAFTVGQSTGILLNFAMPLMWISMWLHNES